LNALTLQTGSTMQPASPTKISSISKSQLYTSLKMIRVRLRVLIWRMSN